MNRVGHAFIKQRMRQEDAIFGGEVTGHYYFRDFYYADNGFIPALLMLELMSKKNQSLHQLVQPFRERYFISGEINTKLASMEEVPHKLAAIEAHGVPTGPSSTVSLAVRWHGTRPAALWEQQGAPVRLTSPVLAPKWGSTEPSGETLWPAPN